MPSRRQLLTAITTVTAAGLAGCSGSATGGSDTLDCQTLAVEHGDGTVLEHGVMADVVDDDVRLGVPLSVEAVREHDLDRIEVFDATDSLAYTIPVSAGDAAQMANKVGVSEGQLYYEQYLGERPFHGRYRVVAVDADGETADSLVVEFNCFPEVERD
ncbi:hypothetical protein [Halorarius litoreus]|uniref:hypothetical protein n=1 Tax=Halorarius litoreus TaxID=2962676 RepID=UPI0020CC5D6A|nr:hypothetical protein [Halorarius litoreus]